MLLVLERKGNFRASSMIPNSSKCGAMAMIDYSYAVKIEADAGRLSPEGYVINNEHVQTYFDTRFGEAAQPWHAVSCEHMAKMSCEELAKSLLTQGIGVKCVKVTLEGSNGALITAEWTYFWPMLLALKAKVTRHA